MIRAQTSTRLFAAAVFLVGCTKADTSPGDTVIATDTASTAPEATTPVPDTASAIAPVGDSASRATVGAVHKVRMVADGERFSFEPAKVIVAAGDIVRFEAVDGVGHNVAFDGSGLSSRAQNQLDRNIAHRAGPLASAPVAEAGEAITVSFAGMNPGTYPFHCAAHAALGMRGSIEVASR